MRGCLLVRDCGCSTLDGRPYKQCDRHKAENEPSGEPRPVHPWDAWLNRQPPAEGRRRGR